ncbi:hypothetical protein BRAS3843_460026 [Bradyrhizobium sp. STM 3843]|nr:hypothetical protein BRAS3843_460026 [Bradyrhizobium sp. STM 3843]
MADVRRQFMPPQRGSIDQSNAHHPFWHASNSPPLLFFQMYQTVRQHYLRYLKGFSVVNSLLKQLTIGILYTRI